MCTICQTFRPIDTGTCDYDVATPSAATATAGTDSQALAATLPVYTLDQIAYQLTDGFYAAQGGSWRAFDLTALNNVITYNVASLTAAGQVLAQTALQAWSEVTGIQFVQTTATNVRLMFDDAQSGAYSTSSYSGNTLLSSTVNVSSAWLTSYGTTVGTYSYQTYLHEIGHALGLGHAGNYNGAADYAVDAIYANDSWQATLMSYFSQSENTYVSDSYAFTVTPMLADIVAIRNLYGNAVTVRATNTVYGDGHTTGNGIYGLAAATALTLFDTGGTDTINLASRTQAQRLDLNAEAVSDINGLTGNLSIARGTTIENARTGSGFDVITGNAAANQIWAGGGADTVLGGDGNDLLSGEAGADELNGGLGADRFWGGTEGDRIYGEAGTDSIWGEAGDDLVWAGTEADGVWGGAGIDTLHGEAGNDLMAGGDGGDLIYGEAGMDTVYGEAGADTLWGGSEADALYGGLDADRVLGEAGADSLWGGAGADDLYGGTESDRFWGGTEGDRIYGEAGADSIWGEAGDDLVWAGTEADGVWGGAGIDTLHGEGGGDLMAGGDGGDLIYGEIGMDTIYGEAGADTLWGGDEADALYGGLDADSLYGEAGADRLVGGAGADTLTGGLGADVFVFANGCGSDRIADFTASEVGEVIDLIALDAIVDWTDLVTSHMVQSGADILIDTGLGDVIVIANLALGALDAGDFLF